MNGYTKPLKKLVLLMLNVAGKNSSLGEMFNHLASKGVSVITRVQQALKDKEKIIYQPSIKGYRTNISK